MKEKIKKIILGYLLGFITGLIICGTISVIAATYFPSNDVTYDNSASGLTSNNVQGAIDELYGVCFPPLPAGEQIIEDAGLEKDPYECRYFFTGANPNNYITFNGETAGWRIISVECDGTIKIMKDASIGSMVWDSSSNDWGTSDLGTYLDATYYNGLNGIAQNQIVAKDWSIGAVTWDNNNLADQINDENGTKWNGKVALATASEYIRTNSNKNSCASLSLINNNYSSCRNTNWMFNSANWWIMSPRAGGSNGVFGVLSNGNFAYNFVDYSNAVRPVLYLSSEVTLSGSGTQSDPYVVN